MSFFDINNTFFQVLGYAMSYIEFFGTIAGIVAVWLAAKGNAWNWPIGLINVVLFFFLFYQVQLYPDMFLQVFFFVTNLIGWWRWTHPKPKEEDDKHELKVSYLKRKYFALILLLGIAGTMLFGTFAKNLHEIFPVVFNKPSAFPYIDSFITVMSIITTFLIIQKKIEGWMIYIVVDAIASYVYFVKGIKFVGLEYIAFTLLAIFGLLNWMKEYKSYPKKSLAVKP